MQYYYIITTGILFWFSVHFSMGQTLLSSKVPEKVKLAQSSQYGKSTVIWQMLGDLYLADFRINHKRNIAYWTSEGLWHHTQSPAPLENAPIPLRMKVFADFPQLTHCYLYYLTSPQDTGWKTEINYIYMGKEKDTVLRFNNSGALIPVK